MYMYIFLRFIPIILVIVYIAFNQRRYSYAVQQIDFINIHKIMDFFHFLNLNLYIFSCAYIYIYSQYNNSFSYASKSPFIATHLKSLVFVFIYSSFTISQCISIPLYFHLCFYAITQSCTTLYTCQSIHHSVASRGVFIPMLSLFCQQTLTYDTPALAGTKLIEFLLCSSPGVSLYSPRGRHLYFRLTNIFGMVLFTLRGAL